MHACPSKQRIKLRASEFPCHLLGSLVPALASPSSIPPNQCFTSTIGRERSTPSGSSTQSVGHIYMGSAGESPCCLLLGAPGTAFYQPSMDWGLAGKEVRSVRVSLFQSCLNHRDSGAGKNPNDQMDERGSKVHPFPQRGSLVHAMIVGGVGGVRFWSLGHSQGHWELDVHGKRGH